MAKVRPVFARQGKQKKAIANKTIVASYGNNMIFSQPRL
jgi:hypothetical protein